MNVDSACLHGLHAYAVPDGSEWIPFLQQASSFSSCLSFLNNEHSIVILSGICQPCATTITLVFRDNPRGKVYNMLVFVSGTEDNALGRILVIAEKPSVGRDIARVLGCRTSGDGCLIGDRYTVTWAVGHLVTLAEPDELDERLKKWSYDTLPILPQTIPLKVISATKAQFTKVKKLMNDKETDRLICATDAGREGELIFRYIYEMSGCTKPFDRLWISSMTDEAISEGFKKIRPGADYDGLYRSALCRSHADWLVGMNASRAFTLRYGVLLSVGRVQTPTLAILVKRFKEIRDFKPESYCTLTADFGDYKGILFSQHYDPDTHIPSKEEADRIAAAIKGKTATVVSAETQRKRELPPQLYDLTSLQRDANRLLGFTADKTLKIAQSLYETRKALTYPRTDSRYLPPDMIPRVVQTMKLLPDAYQKYVPGALPDGKLPVSKRTIDETKVTDHHAIIPTNRKVDPSMFTEDERKLWDLVARRMITAFWPACDYDATRIITEAEGNTFRSTGRTILVNGWHDVPAMENPPKPKKKASADQEEEAVLPPLSKGDQRTVVSSKVKQDATKPPSPHTDASLLAAMETAGKELSDEEIAKLMKGSGIGTPATRAAIIERLIQVGYAERKGKTISATPKGVSLIEIMPGEIASPELTGRWELALHEITDGKQDADRFMQGIRDMSSFLVRYARQDSKQVTFPEDGSRKGRSTAARTPFKNEPIEGAVCPLCGQGHVTESKLAFGCDNAACHFTLWKDCLVKGGGPMLNAKLITLLLQKKQLAGSTGGILLHEGKILFYPKGKEFPSVVRDMAYQKAQTKS